MLRRFLNYLQITAYIIIKIYYLKWPFFVMLEKFDFQVILLKGITQSASIQGQSIKNNV